MPRLKRTRDEALLDLPPTEPQVAPELQNTLQKLRSQWEFASFMQYIHLFGSTVKIDDNFDIEDLEAECLNPTPTDKLPSIGLTLLKYVSSHRGLTLDIFDEYTRRQYEAKAPARNPFGQDETPRRFNDLDVFTRIRVLHQLSTWTFNNADRMRGLVPQDDDHLDWRMEPLGWDKDDRAYFVLDDNRLYRRADVPVPPSAPKAKAKPQNRRKSKAKTPKKTPTRGTRQSKRRRVEEADDDDSSGLSEPPEEDVDDDVAMTKDDLADEVAEDDEPSYGFTSKTWSCIAVTLEEYQDFQASIFRSRDPNEKQLHARIEEHVIPVIEKRAEAIRQKQLKKLRELENLQKMATAKRSSRIADKADRERQERDEREAEEKRRLDLKMALAEQERQRKIEEGHESRRLTREQRVRERETKRILHEEQLARLEADSSRATSQDPHADLLDAKRISERQLQSQKEQHQRELEKLAAEAEDGSWIFDCAVCGLHGENYDDGSHSIACDRCGVWQHSKCHGFTPKQAEKEDFKFVCQTCRRKEKEEKEQQLKSLVPTVSQQEVDAESRHDVAASRASVLNGTSSVKLEESRLTGETAVKDDPFQGPGPASPFAAPPRLAPPTNGEELKVPQQPWSGQQLPPPARPSSSGLSVNQLPLPNSTILSQHQQHHQQALESASGHALLLSPDSRPAQSAPPTAGMLATPQQPPSNALPTASVQPPPQHATPGLPTLLNGFQSPTKQSRPVSRSANAAAFSTPQQSFNNSFNQRLESSPQLHQSPKVDLPPPQRSLQSAATAGFSPVKSSPAPAPPSATHARQSGLGPGSPGINAPHLSPRSPRVAVVLSPPPQMTTPLIQHSPVKMSPAPPPPSQQ